MPIVRNLQLFMALNLLDATLTSIAISYGGAELNPIIRHLTDHSWQFWTYKVVVPLVVAGTLWALYKKYPAQIRRITIVLCVALVIICIWNTVALITLGG